MDTRANPGAAVTEATLQITRVFDAPCALVYKAWTDPGDLMRWMGPRDHPIAQAEYDVRVGGGWRGCLRATDGGPDLWQGGAYLEVIENEKLVFTFAWDQAHPAHGHETRVTVSFSDHPAGGTVMDFRQEFLPSADQRDGHRGGWTSSFDRLDEALGAPRRPFLARTSFIYPADAPAIITSRRFAAAPALVWRAFTTAADVARWWGPRRYANTVEEMDVRPGGAWRIVQRSADGDEYVFWGRYIEVAAPTRLVQTFCFSDFAPVHETISFAEAQGGALVTVVSRFATAQDRDMMRATDMENGAAEAHDRLDEQLAALSIDPAGSNLISERSPA